jgi:L-serine/L-threonine ammonia-lyase
VKTSLKPPAVPIITMGAKGTDCFYWSMALNRCGDLCLPVNVEAVIGPETGLRLAYFTKFSSAASGSLGASQPSERVLKRALEREGRVICATIPDKMAMQSLGLFAGKLLSPVHSSNLIRIS